MSSCPQGAAVVGTPRPNFSRAETGVTRGTGDHWLFFVYENSLLSFLQFLLFNGSFALISFRHRCVTLALCPASRAPGGAHGLSRRCCCRCARSPRLPISNSRQAWTATSHVSELTLS